METRISRCNDKVKLLTFINNHWKENHILVKSDLLFKWMYEDTEQKINFLCLYKNDDIKGILGYVPTYQFDKNLYKYRDYWLTIWKTIESANGFDLYLGFKNSFTPYSIGVIGISDIAFKFYSILRFKTGILNHYYIVNPAKNEFNILKILNKRIDRNKKNINPNFKAKIKDITDNVEILHTIKDLYKPYKSVEYIVNRYLKHPFYKYRILGVFHNNFLLYSFIIRLVNVKGAKAIRIVDAYGRIKNYYLKDELENILIQYDAEYIDFYNIGIDEELIRKIGFEKRENNEIIVPNYFEPFVRENVNIRFAHNTSYDEYVIFKGDSDQDRPNLLNNMEE